jgi:hypothetical protein
MPSAPSHQDTPPPLPWWARLQLRLQLLLTIDPFARKAWVAAAQRPELACRLAAAGISVPHHKGPTEAVLDPTVAWTWRHEAKPDASSWQAFARSVPSSARLTLALDRFVHLDAVGLKALLEAGMPLETSPTLPDTLLPRALGEPSSSFEDAEDGLSGHRRLAVANVLIACGADLRRAVDVIGDPSNKKPSSLRQFQLSCNKLLPWLHQHGLTATDPMVSVAAWRGLVIEAALHDSTHMDNAKAWIQAGLDPRSHWDISCFTPHSACVLGHLLSQHRCGEDVERQQDLEQLFFQIAHHGAPLRSTDTRGRNLLHMAFGQPWGASTPPAILRAILAAHPEALDEVDQFGCRPADYLHPEPETGRLRWNWDSASDQSRATARALAVCEQHALRQAAVVMDEQAPRIKMRL